MSGSEAGAVPVPARWTQSGLRWVLLTLVIFALDQWTKHLASTHLSYGEPMEVIPSILNWTLLHNYGGAFSFLSSQPGWQWWFFVSVATVVSVILLVWLRRTPASQWVVCLPLALVLAGAIGNVLDRVRLGYVVDFIQVYWKDWYFPAFNIADSGITVAAVWLISYELFGRREGKAKGT